MFDKATFLDNIYPQTGTIVFDNIAISSEPPTLYDLGQKKYSNTFGENEKYINWKTGIGQRWDDTLILTDVPEGKKMSFNRTSLWGGYAMADFPKEWDFYNIASMKIVAQSAAGQTNDLTIMLNNGYTPIIKNDITVTDKKQTFVIPLNNNGTDLSEITSIFFTSLKEEQIGDIIISEISFTN